MPLTAQEVAVLRPPDGWRWLARPTRNEFMLGNDLGEYEWGRITLAVDAAMIDLQKVGELTGAFAAWARANDLATQVDVEVRLPLLNFVLDAAAGAQGRTYMWKTIYVHPIRARGNQEHYDKLLADSENGMVRYAPGVTTDREGVTLRCCTCGFMGVRLRWVEDAYYCDNCIRHCNYRGPRVDGVQERCSVFVSRMFAKCREHEPRVICVECNQERGITITAAGPNGVTCHECLERMCVECGRIPPAGEGMRFNEVVQANLCLPCNARYVNEDKNEQFDPDETVTPEDLLIPNHDNRPVRLASIEMEIAEGGAPIIAALENVGLTTYGAIQGYHHGGRQNDFCYMERDGSLGETGGELIFDRIQMNDAEDIRKLHQAVRIVRNAVNNRQATMDMRCGLHIHVDAHQFGVPHVRNLALLFNYLEDPLYRMSAARYMRHRGMGYAAKIGKEGMADDRAFGMHFLNHNNHGHALHVGNYWAAVRNACRCGAAVIGAHETCECNLGKCTFEFRIYNGTTNYRKIHAYAALSQSLVAFARAHNALKLEDYAPMDYNHVVRDVTELTDGWFERLRWMFANLYFSPGERKSMLYVIENCQLQEIGAARIAELEATEYVDREARKVEVIHRNLRGVQNARAAAEADDDVYYDDDEEVPFDVF